MVCKKTYSYILLFGVCIFENDSSSFICPSKSLVMNILFLIKKLVKIKYKKKCFIFQTTLGDTSFFYNCPSLVLLVIFLWELISEMLFDGCLGNVCL